MRAFTNCRAERTYAAVGWGGTDWSTDWSVMLRKTWQSNSKERKPATCHGAIPTLSPGRYYHGIASIDYQIWVCGGMFNGGARQKSCYYIDTNDTEATWQQGPSMAYVHAWYELISYGGSLYAIGGYDQSETNIMERYTPGEGWVRMANMPYTNHRFCAVADEENDRIYMIGGSSTANRYQVRYYKVSTNSWHSPVDKTTKYYTYDCAAVIVGWPRSNHRRIMIVYGRNSKTTNYMWLDPESSWSTTTASSFNTDFMKAVSLSKWEHYLMGGRTSSYHGDGSRRNWYVFNPHNTRFEDYGLYMQRGHDRADFTRIPEDAAMLRNCKLN